MVGTDSDARKGAIREDENGSDGGGVRLDLSRNAFLSGPRLAEDGECR